MKQLMQPATVRLLEYVRAHPQVSRAAVYAWCGQHNIDKPSVRLSNLQAKKYVSRTITRDGGGYVVHLFEATRKQPHIAGGPDMRRPASARKLRQADNQWNAEIRALMKKMRDLPVMDPNIACFKQWRPELQRFLTPVLRPGALDYKKYPSIINGQEVYMRPLPGRATALESGL